MLQESCLNGLVSQIYMLIAVFVLQYPLISVGLLETAQVFLVLQTVLLVKRKFEGFAVKVRLGPSLWHEIGRNFSSTTTSRDQDVNTGETGCPLLSELSEAELPPPRSQVVQTHSNQRSNRMTVEWAKATRCDIEELHFQKQQNRRVRLSARLHRRRELAEGAAR